MIISAVPTDIIPVAWPQVKTHLSKALNVVEGGYTLESLYEQLLTGEQALWVMMDEDTEEVVGAATTRICVYPKKNSLAIDWVAGERMADWLPAFSRMMDTYAKDHECTQIEGFGRRGWIKALAPYGYREWYPTFRKELEDG